MMGNWAETNLCQLVYLVFAFLINEINVCISGGAYEVHRSCSKLHQNLQNTKNYFSIKVNIKILLSMSKILNNATKGNTNAM